MKRLHRMDGVAGCELSRLPLSPSRAAISSGDVVDPTIIPGAALAIRCKQFAAVLDPARTVAIARAIVAAKVRAEGHRREAGQAFLAGLQRAKTVEAVRHVEAQAAQEFWRQWAGFEMRFAGPTVAADWHSWPGSSRDG